MRNVLLIEDEAGIRRTLTVSLMQNGYSVIPAEDGLTGLSRMDNYVSKGKSPDAVILDINLPDINGFKVLQFLKEKHPEIPVVMISGFGDEITEEEVISRKGDAYLPKPVTSEKLDEYLQGLLKKKDAILADHTPKAEDEIKLDTRSAYAFIKIEDEDRFLPVFQKLYFMNNVMYADAVKGRFDMVLLLHGKSTEDLDDMVKNISDVKGIGEVYHCHVEKPVLSEDLTRIIDEMEKFLNEENPDCKTGMTECSCSAYSFLEIDPERFEDVYRSVYFMDNVVSCDTLNGPFQMALLLKAPTFGEIDKLVTGQIARLDGVLRATQCNIINLIEM